jgi:hypothetical protein
VVLGASQIHLPLFATGHYAQQVLSASHRGPSHPPVVRSGLAQLMVPRLGLAYGDKLIPSQEGIKLSLFATAQPSHSRYWVLPTGAPSTSPEVQLVDSAGPDQLDLCRVKRKSCLWGQVN